MARTGLQKGIKKADTSQYPFLIFFIGRNDWTRTSDLFVPNEAFYQAELHSVTKCLQIITKNLFCKQNLKIFSAVGNQLIMYAFLSGKNRMSSCCQIEIFT